MPFLERKSYCLPEEVSTAIKQRCKLEELKSLFGDNRGGEDSKGGAWTYSLLKCLFGCAVPKRHLPNRDAVLRPALAPAEGEQHRNGALPRPFGPWTDIPESGLIRPRGVRRNRPEPALPPAEGEQCRNGVPMPREGGGCYSLKEHGKDAVLCAVECGHFSAVRWLIGDCRLSAGEVLDRQDNCTALLKAAERGRLSIVQWLVEKGGSKAKEEKDNGDGTALLLAAMWAI
eukprot:TRINITY_DN59068_c0_g1_i1.p1 TRINITY_DN59068_c0_g1~~TRINITY_DN59068_c0_g1_i1.p1  ORF type:complete len:230 (-),score=22.60 TRINITY_DN59068_c0_g1_i1:179-868(-)